MASLAASASARKNGLSTVERHTFWCCSHESSSYYGLWTNGTKSWQKGSSYGTKEVKKSEHFLWHK
jgi:hypothetical protein